MRRTPVPPLDHMPGAALVIIPTYNEQENIERLVKAVLAQGDRFEVLIVDDNSPDGTGALADAMAAADSRIHVLHRPGKLGLGTAYLDGFRWGLARDYAFLMEMDADFSHDPEHLPEFIRAIDEADVVLGSRYRQGRVTVVNWPMTRLLLSYFANIYARVVTGLAVEDLTGGFKCFRREVLMAIDLQRVRSNGYAFQIEMSVRAAALGFRLKEIPITFTDRTEGTSKMSGGIVREAVLMVWRLRWWWLTGQLTRRPKALAAG
jgi:dolichol-phosphate mannosyltransferase